MTAYYNENDPFAADWLRELIKSDCIADGYVDERSIEDVSPNELKRYTQCHFFAGIGIWSYALRQEGWSDDRTVWTGSCPCQPFSAAGKRKGTADERHLWPAFFHLISECRPVTVFGEQVASKDGLAWLDLVSSDLEGAGYAIGAADTCAAGFGAPHIRQRLYFVAESQQQRCEKSNIPIRRRRQDKAEVEQRGIIERVADSQPQYDGSRITRPSWRSESSDRSDTDVSVNPTSRQAGLSRCSRQPRETDGFWANAEWLPCIDGKARPVEPGTFPLAHGAPNRVGRLRGYGNALVAPQAQAFIEAYLGESV